MRRDLLGEIGARIGPLDRRDALARAGDLYPRFCGCQAEQ